MAGSPFLRGMLAPLSFTAMLAALCGGPAHALTLTAAKTSRAGLQDLYFMRCGPGWTGGDSTYSLKLATGEIAWLFSDSFYGRVAANADGTRTRTPGEFGFATGNSLVRQRTDGVVSSLFHDAAGQVAELNTYALYTPALQPNPSCPAAGTAAPGNLAAFLRPANCGSNCLPWIGAPFVGTDGRMRAFVHHHLKDAAVDADGVTLPAWTYMQSSLSKLALAADGKTPAYGTAASYAGITLPSAWSANKQAQIAQRIRWGGAVLRATVSGTDYFFIYGTRQDGTWGTDGIGVYLARVPAAKVDDMTAWRFWSRSAFGMVGFIGDQASSVPLANASAAKTAPRTGHALGVLRLPACGSALPSGCYVMLGHDRSNLDKIVDSNQILAWYAGSPQGPWTGPFAAYTTPESRWTGPGSNDRLTTYDSMPQAWSLSADGRTVLLSYNVNWTGGNIADPNSPFVNADNYRPRFIDITFNW